MKTQMNITIVVNNKNNRLANLLHQLKEYCQQEAVGEVEFHSTLKRRHAIALARQAVENGCDYLIAVGGDGTLHEVINGVMQSQIPVEARPVIGLLPYGSANDFARTAGVTNSIEALFEGIRSNSLQEIDLGKITVHESGETRYFINIAGIGLGPEVVQNIERSSSVFGPRFNYFKHIIKGFLGYTKKEVSCTSGTRQWKGKLLQMAVANGRYFGNAICIAPDALINDGQFQLAIFGDLSIWDYLKNLGKLKKGIKIRHPQVQYHEADEILLESKDACGIEADGEYVGLAPATIKVIPRAIRFLIPSNAP